MSALLFLLESKVKTALKQRIINKFATEDHFIECVTNNKQEWANSVPLGNLEAVYEGENGKNLNDLTLSSLIDLCYILGQRLEVSLEESRQLDTLLLKAYCGLNGLKCDLQLDLKILEGFLDRLGIERKELDAALEENESYDMGDDVTLLVEQLGDDSEFQRRFLKCFKHQLGSGETPEKLDVFKEKLNKIDNEGQVQLDNIKTLRESLKREIGQTIECFYCKERLNCPKTLPCLHSFCSKCLKDHINNVDKTVVCPVCERRISVLDTEYVDSMPCCFVMDGLIKFYDLIQSDGSDECSICIQAASHYNRKTGHIFCALHAAGMFHADQKGGQKCIPVTDLLNKEKLQAHLNQYCPQHQSPLTKFCTYCQVATCGESVCINWHTQHGDLKPLEEIFEEQKKDLEQIMSLLDRKIEKIDAKIQHVEANQIHVGEMQENVKESITKYFEDMKARMEDKRLQFIRDLDKAAQTSWHQDEQTRQSLDELKQKVQSVQNEIVLSPRGAEQITSPYPITTLALQRQQVLDLIAETSGGATLAETKAISYPESHLRTLLQSVCNLSSNIGTTISTKGWELVAKMPGLRYFVARDSRLLLVRRTLLTGSQVQVLDLRELSSPAQVHCEGGIHEFQALGFNHKGDLLIPHETQTNLELPNLKMKRSVNVFTYPAAKMQPNNNMPIINVQCLNTYSKVLLKTCVIDDSLGKRTKLFVADDQCIVEMSEKGEVSRKFAFYTMVNISDFAPDMVRDMLVVTDAVKHKLLIFNCRSQQMQAIGSQGVTPGQLNHPSGVDIDTFGHIFVADAGNARIQVFDLNGKFLKLIQYPQSLREVAQAPTAQLNARVVIQTHNDYLYLFDTRLETVWRMKYM